MRKIKSFLICLVTVYLVVFSKPISALSIIDDSDYYLGSNVSMIENTIELNIGEKLKNIDVLNCFRIKNDENVSIKYDSTSIDTDIEKEQELKVTIKDGTDTYVVSINVDIQDTEFSNKSVPVLAYLLLVFLLCLTLTFMGYGKCV
jgi:methionine-rich copper-binding protein CopC